MPRKIKVAKEKKNKKSIINVNNVNYIIIALTVLLVAVCVGVGIYKFSVDKYHAHANNAIVSFVYSERLEREDLGYDVYLVNNFPDKDIIASYSNYIDIIDEKWSRNKFLDFNEEIYLAGILELESQEKVEGTNPDWTLEVELSDGTSKFYTSDSNPDIDKTEFARIMSKYFKREIRFK